MNPEIRKRIELVRRGEVPEGYNAELGYVSPENWHHVHLNDKFFRLTIKNKTNCTNVLTISAQQGLISQSDFYDKEIASEDKSSYFILHKGDFAYNKSYSVGYPYGAIKRLEKYEEGIVSPLYICFSPKENTNADYYAQYFEAGIYNHEIYRIAQEGARNHGLLNIAVDDFCSGMLLCPSDIEQQKIAEILSCCDKIVALKKQLAEQKRQQKKA
ncbi:hypothetical protein SDC9_115060 [bioreactor metagenome]|uniref:Type I restriction modification DNA specificity domain-containing protein n=1 Tax=bioreactor metagenome TaxID=1076179 RepID=A0A645BRS9_9ZZZZ